jgi:redox-sensing transcriptional repressor
VAGAAKDSAKQGPASLPEASVYRLSLYHCYLGDILSKGAGGRITSKTIAEELGVKEESVRRDLSFLGSVGRPGAGYETRTLFDAIQEFLGLSDEYPILYVGSAQMLESLAVVFPSESYGVRPIAYYSELPEDVGKVLHGIEIRHVTEIPNIDPELGITVGLVACTPGWVQMSIDMLDEAGVSGLLLLTPSIRLEVPEGMNIVHVRMPCDIKSLACQVALPGAVRTGGHGSLPIVGGMHSR